MTTAIAEKQLVPSVDKIIDQLNEEIDYVKNEVAPTLINVERAIEMLDARGEQFEYVKYSNRHLTIVYVARDKADLMEVLAALARVGIRRIEGDQAFDCPETMTRLYGMKHGRVILNLHVRLRGEACRRVQVGMEPKYEIVCES